MRNRSGMITTELFTGRRALAAAITAGALLTLSFPPFDLSFLQFPALLLLFGLAIAVEQRREFLKYGYLALFIWNLGTTYWLMLATMAGGLAALLANSALMLLPLGMIRSLHRRRTPLSIPAAVLLGAASWTALEFLHHNWDLAWPWLTLGNAWSNHPWLIQYISVTGHLGISFWVVATSIMGWHLLQKPGRKNAVGTLVLLLLFPLLSLITRSLWQEDRTQSLEVAVVQPNMDTWLSYGGLESADELLTLLLELSDSVRTDQTRLIVWPENALESALPRENRFNSRIRDSLRTWQSDLIAGSGFVEFYDPDELPPLYRMTGNRPYNIYNSALHFTGSGSGLASVYKKGRLVPVVERMPFAETLQKLDLFGLVDWGQNAGYGKGTETNNFHLNGFSTPALVCYDSVFPGWTGGFVRDGADFITIITNDGWWGDTGGHHQHFAYARLRAIEFRRWVVRSANNGISGIIAPDGSIREKTRYWERTAFTRTIHPSDRQTLFARYGSLFNSLLVAGLGVSLLLHLQERRGSGN